MMSEGQPWFGPGPSCAAEIRLDLVDAAPALREDRARRRTAMALGEHHESCPIAMQRAELRCAHQSCDAMLAAGLSRFAEIQEDARRPTDAVTRNEERSNKTQEPGVLLAAFSRPAAGATCSSHSALRGRRVTWSGRCIRLDEP